MADRSGFEERAKLLERWHATAVEDRSLLTFGFAADPSGRGLIYVPWQSDRRFNDYVGTVQCWESENGRAQFRVTPSLEHRNLADTVHGGYMLALTDMLLFFGPALLGVKRALGGTTVECSTRFLSPAFPGIDLDIELEVLRETGLMIFSRGTFRQGEDVVAIFSGTTRKADGRIKNR